MLICLPLLTYCDLYQVKVIKMSMSIIHTIMPTLNVTDIASEEYLYINTILSY